MSTSSGVIHLDDNGVRVQRDLLSSRIVGLFLESLIFGLFLVTYAMGTWSLICRDQPATLSRRNKMLLGVNTLMLVLALVHVSLTVQTTLYGFVAHGATRQTAYDALYSGSLFFSPTNMAQFYLYVTQTLIGDGFMVYRLYVVWNGRWTVLAAPTILFLFNALCGYCYDLAPIVILLVFFGTSFFTNALSSGLIMWRVLRSESSQKQEHWKWHSLAMFNFIKYRRVVEAIIQSAAIYSAASISLVVTMLVSPNVGFYVCLSILPPLIGLVFSLMVIQIARNSAAADSSQPSHAQFSTIVGSQTVVQTGDSQRSSTFTIEGSKHSRNSWASSMERYLHETGSRASTAV